MTTGCDLAITMLPSATLATLGVLDNDLLIRCTSHYRALELLRQPLRFDELVGNGFSQQVHPARVTRSGFGGWSTAMSGHVMRGGRHFVEFASADEYSFFGVIRPVSLSNDIDLKADWEGQVDPMVVTSNFKSTISEKLRYQRTTKWGHSNIHCCVYYYSYSGNCICTDWDNDKFCYGWRGREGLGESGESGTVGLLLDLDEGTLSVFKNGRRLGVMIEGLDGEYCWFVTVVSLVCTISMSNGRVPN